MDGNRRWARARKQTTLSGHKAGSEALRALVKHVSNLGLKYLTVYSFSSENWNRSAAEVKGLLAFIERSLRKEAPDLHAQNVRLRFIGDKSKFSTSLRKTMVEVEKLTEHNTGLTLCPAMNYGAWEEITTACKQIAKAAKAGELNPDKITEKQLIAHLYTHDLPMPDVMIRPGGESRLSNFLMLQSAYAELIFDDTLWPDYTPQHLDQAIQEYQRRVRRYGT